jgi:A/G-specific adenine glycosylase
MFPWRRKNSNRYQRVVSEVLLQRTRAEVVAKVFPDFLARFPSWRRLASATPAELQTFLRPLGLWRRRATSISKLAKHVIKRGSRFPKTREELEKIPAVGQYVASAVLLFCHQSPAPLLDVNMARVLERYFGPRQLADIRYDRYLQALAQKVVQCDSLREINWALLDLGAMVCVSQTPKCGICPVRIGCRWFRCNSAETVSEEAVLVTRSRR